MDCRHINYSDSIELLKDYKPFTVCTCNPYSIMPRSIYDYITDYCYLQDELYGKGLFKHVFTEINDSEFFTFNIYRVPIDFKIPKIIKNKGEFHMETRNELKQIINELKDKLKEAEDKLEKLGKYERFKPKDEEIYWYVNNHLTIESTHFYKQDGYDTSLYNAYNCFQTEEEAEKEANKILIRRKLEDIARHLNGDEKIDWENETQPKYYIAFNDKDNGRYMQKHLFNNATDTRRTQGTIYCLRPNFLVRAKEEIGEQELIDYIKG